MAVAARSTASATASTDASRARFPCRLRGRGRLAGTGSRVDVHMGVRGRDGSTCGRWAGQYIRLRPDAKRTAADRLIIRPFAVNGILFRRAGEPRGARKMRGAVRYRRRSWQDRRRASRGTTGRGRFTFFYAAYIRLFDVLPSHGLVIEGLLFNARFHFTHAGHQDVICRL